MPRALSALLALTLALAPTTAAEEATDARRVSLRDAVRGKLVALDARASRGYSRTALTLRNLAGEPLIVDWSDTYLRPDGGSFQRLALAHTPTTHVRSTTLAPRARTTVAVLSFCMDRKKAGPGNGKRYLIAHEPIREDLGMALAAWHRFPMLAQGEVQTAVWSEDPTRTIAAALKRSVEELRKAMPPVRTRMAIAADGRILWHGPAVESPLDGLLARALTATGTRPAEPEARHPTSPLFEVLVDGESRPHAAPVQRDREGAELTVEAFHPVAGVTYAIAERTHKPQGSATALGRGLYRRDATTGRWQHELALARVVALVGHPTSGHAVLDGTGAVHIRASEPSWTKVLPRRGAAFDGLMLLPRGATAQLIALDRKAGRCYRLVRKHKRFRWAHIGTFEPRWRYGWTLDRFFRLDSDTRTLELRKLERKANYKVLARDVTAVYYGKHRAWIVGAEGALRVYDARTDTLRPLETTLGAPRHIQVRYGCDALYVKTDLDPVIRVLQPPTTD